MSAAAPFAEVEASLAADTLRMLANVEVDLGGGAVPGIFDDGYSLAAAGAMGVSDSSPVLTLLDGNVPDGAEGMDITVRGDTYRVRELRPDGAGQTVLVLERA